MAIRSPVPGALTTVCTPGEGGGASTGVQLFQQIIYTHFSTVAGVRVEALISSICSSRTKCDLHNERMFASMAQPVGP